MIMNGLVATANDSMNFKVNGLNTQSEADDKHISFKDFLKNNSNRNDGVSDRKLPNPAKSANEDVRQKDRPVGRKVFRELEKAIKTEMKKSTLQSGKVDSKEDEHGDDTSSDELTAFQGKKVETMINCMAQVLGVNPDDMKMLLEAAGIKPEELKGNVNLQMVSDKLSQVLNISDKMHGTLTEILKIINLKVDEAMEDTQQTNMDDMSIPSETGKTVLQIKVKIDTESEDGKNNEKISLKVSGLGTVQEKLKLKLQEIGAVLESNKESLVEKIMAEIQPLLQKIQATTSQAAETEPVKAAVPVGEVNDEESAVNMTEDSKTETNTGKDNEKRLVGDGKGGLREKSEETQNTNVQQNTASSEVNKSSQQFVNAFNQIQDKNPQVNDIQAKNHIPAKEIINQVIEKAKVVLTGDKSEMVMDLKPDSLGKISLKVVTEHGIVMAKFVAESQQVKQVLETNMQLLKDSLEKQGLDVQGFSVSVRQESQNRHNGYNGQSENRRIVIPTQIHGSSRLYGELRDNGMIQRVNPYLQEAGTINLRA